METEMTLFHSSLSIVGGVAERTQAGRERDLLRSDPISFSRNSIRNLPRFRSLYLSLPDKEVRMEKSRGILNSLVAALFFPPPLNTHTHTWELVEERRNVYLNKRKCKVDHL